MKTRILFLLASALALALVALAATQSWQAFRQVSAGDGADADLQRTLLAPRFRGAEETVDALVLRGSAEPEAVVSLRNAGTRILQVQADDAGVWSARLSLERAAPMELTLESFSGDNGVRGNEQLLRVPAPGAADGVAQKALILLTAPGQASQVWQTPFGAPLTREGLALESVDYDAAGGLVVAGSSARAGTVRLLIDGEAIGERPVAADEAWYFLAAGVLSGAGADIAVELAEDDEGAVPTVLRARLEPLGARPLQQDPLVWSVRRNLPGGGVQTTAVFATPPEGASDDGEDGEPTPPE